MSIEREEVQKAEPGARVACQVIQPADAFGTRKLYGIVGIECPELREMINSLPVARSEQEAWALARGALARRSP